MTSIICKAYFLNPAETTIFAVSAPFQAALTPWLSTLAAKKYELCSRVATIKCYSLSPTFQYTTGLAVHFSSNEEEQRFMNSDLCAPLFSHLKTFVMQYTNAGAFDDGNAVADFALKFRLLENFRLKLDPASTAPTELIAFYMRMFHSQKISQTLLISIVKSYAENMSKCRYSREKSSDYDSLIKQHKIIPYLVQKMMENYRNDHGETLVVFLKAILHSVGRNGSSGAWARSDFIDELVPMFDLIQTIVGNGDLLHPCFHNQQNFSSDSRQRRKWTLPGIILRVLTRIIVSANYSRLEFMRRYGRTLLPHLADFTFLEYDGSEQALEVLKQSVEIFFSVLDDYFWTDEVESKRDEAGLKKMLVGGRKLLQDVPFSKVESFAIAQQTRLGAPPHFMSTLSHFFDFLLKYCDRVASLRSSELKDAVMRDIASQLVGHNLLPLSLDLVVSSFGRFVRDDETEVLTNCLFRINIFVIAAGTSRITDHLLPVFSALRKNFFMNRDVLEKMLELAQKVCDTSHDAFSIFRYVIDEKRRNNASAWSEKDLKNAKAHKETAEKLIKRILPYLRALLKAAKTTLRENKNEWDGNDNEEGISTDDSHQKLMDYIARIDDFVNIGLRELTVEYQSFVSENQKTMTLLEQP